MTVSADIERRFQAMCREAQQFYDEEMGPARKALSEKRMRAVRRKNIALAEARRWRDSQPGAIKPTLRPAAPYDPRRETPARRESLIQAIMG